MERGWVVLPPPEEFFDPEGASGAEMTIGAQALHLLGLILVTVGAIAYLRVSGLASAVCAGGVLPSGAGLALAAAFNLAGVRALRDGLQGHGQPLVIGGTSVGVLTLGAAHFYFRLVPLWGWLLLTFLWVLWAGSVAIRYDAPALAAFLLLALYLGPQVMTFPLDQAATLVCYLLSIQAATTLLAFAKKWDGFLIASFLASYALYFFSLREIDATLTLGFLLVSYLLNLQSSLGLHLWRRSASEFNQALSLINPLSFACVSYSVLLCLPNWTSLAIFSLLALLHLICAGVAWRRDRHLLIELVQAQLALGILFASAAVSFLTYCSDETLYFSVVAFLWLTLSLFLLYLSHSAVAELSDLLRRGSYFVVGLLLGQSLYVMTSLDQPWPFHLTTAIGLFGYFGLHERRSRQTLEERLFSRLVLVGTYSVARFCLPASVFGKLLVAAGSIPVLQWLGRRYAAHWSSFEQLARVLAAATTLVACSYPWSGLNSLWLGPIAAGVACALPGGVLLIAARVIALVAIINLHLAGLLFILGCLGLIAWGTRWRGLALRLLVVAAMAGLVPASPPYLTLALVAVCLLTRSLVRDHKEGSRECLCLAVLLLLKVFLQLLPGTLSTLAWALLGLALCRNHRNLGLSLLFVSFIKSSLWDFCFRLTQSGVDIALVHLPSALELTTLVALTGVYMTYAYWARKMRELRNFLISLCLMHCAFQFSAIFYGLYGTLDNFQVLLSEFWSVASFLLITLGIHIRIRLLRHFGLLTLSACVAKVYAVDIWVLNAYDQTTTTLALGALLMVVSFLYQLNRTRLGTWSGSGEAPLGCR